MDEADRHGRMGIRKVEVGGGGKGAINQPKSEEERHAAAQRCVDGLELTLPTVIDSMDNAINHAYGAWPDRLFVIGVDGILRFQGEPGPKGFDVEAWDAAIQQVLQEPLTATPAEDDTPPTQ